MKLTNRLALTLISTIFIALVGCAQPPTEEIANAEAAMEAARAAEAPELAASEYASAEEMMNRTYSEVADGTYDQARDSAITTTELAETARAAALQNRSVAEQAAREGADGEAVGPSFTEAEVADQLARTRTGAGSLDEGTTVSNLDPIYFEYDSSQLSSAARTALQAHARWLEARPSVRIKIEGHTDEQGEAEYNLALGERRALTAKQYLVDLGIVIERLATVSFGEEAPEDPGHNDQAYNRNRRALFVVE
jgi:peptidoglycan-associated lipoprotein